MPYHQIAPEERYPKWHSIEVESHAGDVWTVAELRSVLDPV